MPFQPVTMRVGRGQGMPWSQDFEIWVYFITFLVKKLFSWFREGIMKFHHLCLTRKIFLATSNNVNFCHTALEKNSSYAHTCHRARWPKLNFYSEDQAIELSVITVKVAFTSGYRMTLMLSTQNGFHMASTFHKVKTFVKTFVSA